MAENKSAYPDNIICPRQLFGHDLRQFLETLTAQGHQLIVCGDFNSEYSELSDWMLDLALTDMIADRHGPGPKTYNRSKDMPIDCFFWSACFYINKGGYLPFGRLQSDHRGLWLDLPTHTFFGHLPPPTLQTN